MSRKKICLIPKNDPYFPEIPSSVRLAILLPTVRWTPMAKAIIGALTGTANEEVAILISDNSTNPEKRDFLEKIHNINPYVIPAVHGWNLDGPGNWNYVYGWSKDTEYYAQLGDDDWVSPTYFSDAYRVLLENPGANAAEAGTSLADFGDGNLVNISQPTMAGNEPAERIRHWHGFAARITSLSTSRRRSIDPALSFFGATPFWGLTLGECLWELSRLATGDFLKADGPGCFVHYPEHGSRTDKLYNLLCKGVGLAYPAVHFMGLSTAVQCALFLSGNMSPIQNPSQKATYAQHAFDRIFRSSFLRTFAAESSQAVAAGLFAGHPDVLQGFLKYCNPPWSLAPWFDREFLDWFIRLIAVFEPTPAAGEELLSLRFRNFAARLLESA